MTTALPPGADAVRPAAARWLMIGHLSPTARMLIASRAARSLGQGALAVDFALYLAALRWNAVQIGGIYMGGLVIGAGLTLASGPLSDRWGRKPFLLGYGVAQVLAAIVALITSAPGWIVAAAVVGAYGRGANGAAGPFGPVEQAWLSDGLAEADFGAVYSLNSAVGFAGMALGALAAALPALWAGWLPGALRYRPLFLLVLVGSLITPLLLARMTDARHPRGAPEERRSAPAEEPAARQRQHTMLLRLMGINSLNGLAIGVIGPFMALWFQLRFGKGPGAIGPVMALGFFMGAVGAMWSGWLTRRLGTAMTVVAMRLAGLVLLIALPFAPTYGLAAACYVLRSAFNQGTAGARQAVGLRLVGPARRGLAASLNAISMQIPRAVGPVFGGVLLDTGLLALPMLVAAGLQAVYLALYAIAFRRID
ncbi:MAG TPA: MFS transporter [Stellaceae bacterium]|nr:MFS transporter [Stellaceae bacterium]